ncbi:hypothetical protein [Dyella silvatica]|uniref:hypothetical protein n=1 Tax=Dyella silvatica TaxID=2992128 RepID=UPI002257CD62|nr:hypothetical protein [Dyella silvatica]
MRTIFALTLSLLSLFSCDHQPGTTIVTISSDDSEKLFAATIKLSHGIGDFQCARSTEGNCYYVVFLNHCVAGSTGDHQAAGQCTAKLLEQFMLASGQSKQISGLPDGVKSCVAHEAIPVAPGCAK